MYAVLTNGKLYRSTDGARSFKLVSPKLGIPPWAIAATGSGGFVGGDMDTGAYESANATKWQRTRYADTKGGKMVMEYAVQPTDSTHVLMSAFGVEISTDGGKTWHPALKSSVMFGPVAWAASAPDTAYAVGFDGSVWRTDDAGKTWKKVHDFPEQARTSSWSPRGEVIQQLPRPNTHLSSTPLGGSCKPDSLPFRSLGRKLPVSDRRA